MRGVVLVLVVASLGWAAGAEAQRVRRSFMLGVDTALLDLQRGELDLGSRDRELKDDRFGFVPRFGVRFGYGVRARTVIGLVLGVQATHREVGDSDQEDSVEVATLPFVRFLFGRGRARGFVGLLAGLSVFRDDVGDTRLNLFNGGAELGLHAFATRGLSIDPTLQFVYRAGGGETDALIEGLLPDQEADFKGYRFTFAIALTGWL